MNLRVFIFCSIFALLAASACTKKTANPPPAKECAHILPPICQPHEEVVMAESYTGCLAPRCQPKKGCAAVTCPQPEACLPGERMLTSPPPEGQCCPAYSCAPAGAAP